MRAYKILPCILISMYFWLLSDQSLAQSVTDENGVYTSSVEPIKTITFRINSSGTRLGCKVNWTGTNTINLSSDPNAPVTTSNSDVYNVRFQNVSGVGSLTAVLSNCINTSENGVTGTYSAPIRYLGSLGTLSLNSSSTNPQQIGCGAQTVTLSVGAATNATNYAWNLSNLPGWTITSGQNTNTITATTSAGSGGTVQVTATRNDASEVSSIKTITVNRPGPPSVSSTLSGNAQGCYNQSGTYGIVGTLPNAYSVNWSVTGPHSINSSTSSNVTVNYGSSPGIGYISAFITDVCSYTANPQLQVGVGTPYISNITYDGSSNSGPAAASGGSTHYLAAYAPNSTATTWSLGVTNNFGDINTSLSGVNGGYAQIYVSGTVGNSAINIEATNVCGSSSAAFIIYIPSGYRIGPNPAKESLTIEFTDTKDQLALPDQIDIISEKTLQTVRSINIGETFKSGGFEDGNKVTFDTEDLPRGTYYLKVINPRQEKEKQVEMTRLYFE